MHRYLNKKFNAKPPEEDIKNPSRVVLFDFFSEVFHHMKSEVMQKHSEVLF